MYNKGYHPSIHPKGLRKTKETSGGKGIPDIQPSILPHGRKSAELTQSVFNSAVIIAEVQHWMRSDDMMYSEWTGNISGKKQSCTFKGIPGIWLEKKHRENNQSMLKEGISWVQVTYIITELTCLV